MTRISTAIVNKNYETEIFFCFSDCQCMPRHSPEPGKNFNVLQFEQTEKTTKTPKFKKGQKLEMVEPSTLNCITVGTIVKVLGFGNLMIAADGKGGKIPKGDEQICVPATSPFLLPLGYCDKYRTQLKPPPHYRGKFLWPDYLMDTGSVQAPDECFFNFEAVNVGKPRLTVGSRVRVVFQLNFNYLEAKIFGLDFTLLTIRVAWLLKTFRV